MNQFSSISKVWIINLVLVLVVLFVYGGLSWFDSKDPEKIEVKEAVSPSVSFSEKFKSLFSSDKSQSGNNQVNDDLEYGYTEDGVRLPLADQNYDREPEDLSPTNNIKENRARLNQVVQEIAQLNHQLAQLVLVQSMQPNNEEINAAIEDAENQLYALQDERESLMAQVNGKQSGRDEF